MFGITKVIVDTIAGGRYESEHPNWVEARAVADSFKKAAEFRAIRVFDANGRIIAQAYRGDKHFR